MKVTKLIKVAMTSIWNNKMRSFLTMLGIIIGISSVIVLVGIGEGTKQRITEQIEKLGTNLITINITGNTKGWERNALFIQAVYLITVKSNYFINEKREGTCLGSFSSFVVQMTKQELC